MVDLNLTLEKTIHLNAQYVLSIRKNLIVVC
jgi:hypothetical protein